MTDDEPIETFYSEERWQNWIDRIREEELDPQEEDSARLLLNLQDDAAIAVAKVLTAHEEDRIGDDRAAEEINDVREIVLEEVTIDDEDKLMLIDGVQTSLVPVFYAAEEYVIGGAVEEGTVEEYLKAAADAEREEDLDAALGYVVQAGTLVIDGDELDVRIAEDIDYGLVSEWINGLDSLQSALADPEVVDEEE